MMMWTKQLTKKCPYPTFLFLPPAPPSFSQPEAPEAAVEEETSDEAVCYLRSVHMSPYKVS